MNCIGLTNRNSGCGYHRVILPLAYMDGIKGYVTNVLTEDKKDGWDVLLYNRVSGYDNSWQKLKDEIGIKVVMDIDDYWILPPNHLNYYDYQELQPRIESNLANADIVTVTNNELAEKVRTFNENVFIVPNALPYGLGQFADYKRESQRVRIFWAGGVTHKFDIELLRGPVKRLHTHKSKIQMVIGGYNDGDPYSKHLWSGMFSAFTDGGNLPYLKIHGTSPLDYMDMYQYADIMLIPLEDSEWHGCKSNLKILEAAAKKVPCIVSRVKPYSNDLDAPVLWVERKSDWFEHINFLIHNEQERKEMGERLHAWASEKYNFSRINEGRKQLFESICPAPALL